LPKSKLFEISAMIARSFALPSHIMIHKQFLSRDGNATILPPLHCRRQTNIPRVSIALNSLLRKLPIVACEMFAGPVAWTIPRNRTIKTKQKLTGLFFS
jgi:hypothetical protein